jgi:FkbM family methyltransferase
VSVAHHFNRIQKGLVHAFEPNPRAFAYLHRNLVLNRLDNLKINQTAIADQAGSLRMYVSPRTVTIGSLRCVDPSLTECIQIPVTTLDKYMSQYPTHKVGLIKIDIEGGELLALHGAQQVIERDRPLIMYEEYEGFCQAFGYTIRDIRGHLQSLGYRLFVIRPNWLYCAHLLATSAQEAGQYKDTQNILAVPADDGLANSTSVFLWRYSCRQVSGLKACG